MIHDLGTLLLELASYVSVIKKNVHINMCPVLDD